MDMLADISTFESIGGKWPVIDVPLNDLISISQKRAFLPQDKKRLLMQTSPENRKEACEKTANYLEAINDGIVTTPDFAELLNLWDGSGSTTYQEETPVQNIRINAEDLFDGNYNVDFYANVLPNIISYVKRHFGAIDSDTTTDEIADKIDGDRLMVGVSEKQLSDPVWVATKAEMPYEDIYDNWFHKEEENKGRQRVQALFAINNPSSENRVVARRCGEKIARKIWKKGEGFFCGDTIAKSFDVMGRLCDNLGIDCTAFLPTIKVKLIEKDDNEPGAYYNPSNNTIYIEKEYLRTESPLCHELVHALLSNDAIKSVCEKKLAIPRKINTEYNGIEMTSDLIRLLIARNKYASRVYDTNDSEYYSQLIQDYIGGYDIPRLWAWDAGRKLKKLQGVKI